MVIADGSILTVSESQNSDLFWAIRGGGCNFGVVCEFVYRLHDQRPTVYSGIMIFPPHLVDQVIEVTARWSKGLQRPEASMVQALTRGPPPECAVRRFCLSFTYLAQGMTCLKRLLSCKAMCCRHSFLQRHSRTGPRRIQRLPRSR